MAVLIHKNRITIVRHGSVKGESAHNKQNNLHEIGSLRRYLGVVSNLKFFERSGLRIKGEFFIRTQVGARAGAGSRRRGLHIALDLNCLRR